MKKIILLIAITVASCVPRSTRNGQVLEAYRKGLKVGVVIGRDDVLYHLKSPSCFNQTADDLMNDYDQKITKGNRP